MSSLSVLRSRLQKAKEERQQLQTEQTTDTLTVAAPDLTGWQSRIQEQGNKPRDWLEVIRYVSKSPTFSSEENRHWHLSCLYDRGLKLMDADTWKYDEPYAQFLISYAQFKSHTCKDQAREVFNQARVTAKYHAIVHIAAAQFELTQGNKGKCRKILDKAKSVQARPQELLEMAYSNFVKEKSVLLPDIESAGKENDSLNTRLVKRGSVDSDSGQSSQESSTELHFNKTCTKTYRQALKELVPSTPKQPHSAGEIVFDTSHWDNTVSFKAPPSSTNRSRHVSRDSDDADTLPVAFNSLLGSYGVDSASKPKLRSYHSTPDCKSQGQTSMPSTGKRKFVGRPMRVARTSLAKLMEDDDDNGHKHLVNNDKMDTADLTNGLAECTIETMKSVTISPVAEDSGVADVRHKMTSEISRDGSSNFTLPKAKRPNTDIGGLHLKDSGEPKPGVVEADQKQETSGVLLFQHQRTSDFVSPLPVFSQMSSKKKAVPPMMPKMANNDSGLVESMPVCTAKEPKRDVPQPIATKQTVVEPQPKVEPKETKPPMIPALTQDSLITVKGCSYFITKVIGRGGSSKVYKVFDFENKRELAIKHVNLEGVGESSLTGYLNEITLLKRLQYSNKVIRLYDFEYSASKQSLYVIMEVGDTDLATLFRSHLKQDQLTPIMIQFYWMEMLKAVQVLHKEGIIHSDLKPANFILVAGKLKLIDFGIANAIQEDHTSVIRDSQVGTLNFMSPESILGQSMGAGVHRPQFKIGVKSDVWSLGCILYNMVYGKTPFQHITNQIAKLQAITSNQCRIDFPPLDNAELVNILKSCLQRDPKQRPSIDDLLQKPW